MKIKYTGTTERGRRVVEDTFEACVDSLVFVARQTLAVVVTVNDRAGHWYLYANRAAADTDAQRAPHRCGWFATIDKESVR